MERFKNVRDLVSEFKSSEDMSKKSKLKLNLLEPILLTQNYYSNEVWHRYDNTKHVQQM